MKSKILIVFMLMFFSGTIACANSNLTSAQLDRAKAAKRLLGAADQTSFQQHVEDIINSPAPEGSLQILEAVAKVYHQMAKDYEISEPGDRERLLGKIRMNMAYYQLGGPDIERDGEGLLNIVIRRKLKKTLSSKVFDDRRLFYSLTD